MAQRWHTAWLQSASVSYVMLVDDEATINASHDSVFEGLQGKSRQID